MGYVRLGEKPEWSLGVCQLISMGMDALSTTTLLHAKKR
jgi:hypothetical protein